MGNMWLYNGVELPALPEWNTEAYPYALISYTRSPEFYTLRCFTVEPAKGISGSTLVPQSGTGQYISCTTKGEEWTSFGEPTNFTALMGSVFEGRIWTNFDLRTKEGDYVWLAASDPVPVSPVKLNPALLVQSFFTGQAIRRNRT